MLLSTSFAHAQNNPFIGSYGHTEMEFAEQMHILKPHRFSWQQLYGAVNKDIRGTWKVKNDTLHLVLDSLPKKKHPGKILAVLTNAGDLKLVEFRGHAVNKQSTLERYDKTLPSKKAAMLAKPIDYQKLKEEAKKRKQKQQQRRKKNKPASEDMTAILKIIIRQ